MQTAFVYINQLHFAFVLFCVCVCTFLKSSDSILSEASVTSSKSSKASLKDSAYSKIKVLYIVICFLLTLRSLDECITLDRCSLFEISGTGFSLKYTFSRPVMILGSCISDKSTNSPKAREHGNY